MATVAHQPLRTESAGAANQRALASGLLWAAVVLGLAAWWLRAKYLESGFALAIYVVAGLAIVSAGLAVWLFVTSRRADTASPRNRGIGLILLGAGALLGLSAIWLIGQEGLAGFPEFSLLLIMALIALGAGLGQVAAPGAVSLPERVLNALLRSRQQVMIGLFILAAACLAGFLWLVFAQGSAVPVPMDKAEQAPNVFLRGWSLVYPEAIGLILLTLVFVGAGLWLAGTSENITPNHLRIVVLVVGGLTGLVITLSAVLRIIAWWSPVFGAGVRTWQGQDSWKLWVCIYAVIAGLAIMFASLLLARADVRTNPVLRRLLYGYNAVLSGLLMLALLAVLNIAVYVSFPFTIDWTQTRGMHTLESGSKNVLEGLKEPTRIYVLMAHGDMLTKEVRQLLENATAFSNKLQVTYISPDQEPKAYGEIAVKYPELLREGSIKRGGLGDDDAGRGILIVYGPESDAKAPHAFVSRAQLFKAEPAGNEGKMTLVFKGEDAIMTQMRFLSRNQEKPKIYFTQGNGELDMTDAQPVLTPRGRIVLSPTGSAKLVDHLKNDNYDVRGLVWGPPPKKATPGDLMVYSQKDLKSPDEVPEDAKLLVIAGPHKPYSRSALDALERYLEKGGKLIALINETVEPVGDGAVYRPTGLEGLLKKYNVELTGDFILNFPVAQGQAGPDVYATTPPRSSNKIALTFAGYPFEMWLARTVRPGSSPGGYITEPLLEVRRSNRQQVYWTETDWNHLLNLPNYLLSLRATGKLSEKATDEALPVCLAVSDSQQKPRMVVFGDARFASNSVSMDAPYYDFITSCIEWLAERPANIGIKPKESSTFVLSGNVDYSRMTWLPLGLMLLAVVGAGTGVWVVRRR
jgi:hypothetical protein